MSPALLWAAGVTLVTVAFAGLQNTGHLIGGDISVAKTLWLNLTILTFLVLPAVWWRDRRLDPQMRLIFGLVCASFAARAAIELPILYLTDWWRCSYGMAHDLATAVVAISLFVRARRGGRRFGATAMLGFVVALLFVEAGFAYAFCSVADPATGTYFAGGEARFQTINRATWAAVAAGYPVLAGLLWRYSDQRGAAGSPERSDLLFKPASSRRDKVMN